MIIKLLSQNIEIVKVTGDINKLNPMYVGTAVFSENKIYVNSDEYNAYSVCLHELMHFYIERTGVNQLEKFSKEVTCDLFGYCINQIILENDVNIFKQIKNYIEN